MVLDVQLQIRDVQTDISTSVHIKLEVAQAESGLYIAQNSLVSPLLASGKTPRSAVCAYLDDLLYRQTVEAEQRPGD